MERLREEREMDEEMVEFVREAFEGDEIDMDYEFNAPNDFTRPESDWEAEEAEEWFRSAGGYEPSRKQFVEHMFVVFLSCPKNNEFRIIFYDYHIK
ncbi:hypothetical protein PS1_001777 [Malus domestica]